MIRKLSLLLLAVLFLTCTPLFADGFDQTVSFTNSTNALNNQGFSISPYVGTLNGQAADFFCVDFSHNFGFSQGQTISWNALATPIANSSSFAGTLQYSLDGNSTATAYNNYLEMSWLIQQLVGNLNNNDLNSATNDQLAIWTFTGLDTSTLSPTQAAAIGTLLTDAASAAQGSQVSVAGYEVLTPDYSNFPYSQEMIVISTPEPGTILLLLAGIASALLLGLLRKL